MTKDQDVLDQLQRMLPRPAERDLPPGVARRQRQMLLAAIDNDRAPSRRPTGLRSLGRPGGVAVATAAVVVLVAVGTTGDHTSTPGVAQGTSASPRDRASGGGLLRLTRAADAVAATPALRVRDDQFAYVRSLVRTNVASLRSAPRLGPAHRREVWLPQARRAPRADLGLIREDGDDVQIASCSRCHASEEGSSVGASVAGIDRPTYAWFETLPADPEALLRRLRAEVTPVEGQQRDQAVFERIGDLLGESLVPPDTAAALYRVVARMPGVRLDPDVVDPAGRTGVGVTRRDPDVRTRDEWIFDPQDGAYLGNRSYLVDGDGTERLFSSVAVLDRGVSDAEGRLPLSAG